MRYKFTLIALAATLIVLSNPSASYNNPRASLDVLDGIKQFMQHEGLNKLTELIGIARR